MKVVKATGFVPVKLKRASLPYTAGEIIGLVPEKARKAVADGEAEFVAIPEGVETYDVPDIPTNVKAPVVIKEPAVVEIPPDWKDIHPLKRVNLAKKLDSNFAPPDGKTPTEWADEVIEAEVARRAANPPDQDGQGGT